MNTIQHLQDENLYFLISFVKVRAHLCSSCNTASYCNYDYLDGDVLFIVLCCSLVNY